MSLARYLSKLLNSSGQVPTAGIADTAVSPAKLSTGAPSWDSSGNVTLPDVALVQGRWRMTSNGAGGFGGLDIQTYNGGFATKFSLDGNGVLTLPQGQIKFPATQVASSDANTLDDYEEGTWTPNIHNAGQTNTWGGVVGYYRKVGSLVNCWICADYGNSGTAGTNLLVDGLPFSMGSFSINPGWGTWGANGASVPGGILRSGGGTSILVASGGGEITQSVSFFTGCFSYFTS